MYVKVVTVMVLLLTVARTCGSGLGLLALE
jgi:hypothetical protein